MRRADPRSVVATAAALALLLGGCADASAGSGRSGGSRPQGRDEARCQRASGAARWQGVVRATSTTVALDQYDDYFSPTCIEVPWNTPVTLVVTNFGHMPHTATIRRPSVDTDVDAGATAFVAVPATKVPLRIVCTFHIDQRMFAAVIPVRGGR